MTLDDIVNQVKSEVRQVKTLTELQAIRAEYLGKSGIITLLNKELWGSKKC